MNKDGYTARALDYDLMVAMNSQTYERDIKEVRPGGYLLYDSILAAGSAICMREDITFLGVPLAEMCNQNFGDPRDADSDEEHRLRRSDGGGARYRHGRGRIRCWTRNSRARKRCASPTTRRCNWAINTPRNISNVRCRSVWKRWTPISDKILIDGNTATALGAIYAGCTVPAWYPITPATSVMDAFKGFCEQYRKDPETGKNNYLIIQAEDELAAIGMVLGASWNGARAFTSTAGPGISLMNELLGFGYYAEIPAVVVDVQRVGPSTGMPTRTQQSDLMMAAYASHGDTRHILLFPANPNECFHFAVKAFDLAERFQTPVIMLSDLDIGMNDWVVPRLTWDDTYQPDRGRVLDAEDLEKKIGKFQRYNHEDENFVAARTLAGRAAKRARISPADRGTTSSAATPRFRTSTRK